MGGGDRGLKPDRKKSAKDKSFDLTSFTRFPTLVGYAFLPQVVLGLMKFLRGKKMIRKIEPYKVRGKTINFECIISHRDNVTGKEKKIA